MKQTILFLCGGRSDEHEISLISARNVLNALDRKRFEPVLVGISRQGVWHLEKEDSFFEGSGRADDIRLNEKAPKVSLAPFRDENGRGVLHSDGGTTRFDAVFPILHGPFGEDGTLQGMLEMIGVPYVGSNCGSSWICMDKVLTKRLCQDAGIRVAEFVWVAGPAEIEQHRETVESWGYPVFVKPARLGSSVGVHRVTDASGLRPAVEDAFRYDTKVLVERGISGREIECAVLGNGDNLQVALPGEIIPAPSHGWYSYEAKYLSEDGAKVVVPADLTPQEVSTLQKFALSVFRELECSGMARVDCFLEKGTGKPYLNEVNTIPGFTPISMYPKMWQASGLDYPGLITRLIELAFERSG